MSSVASVARDPFSSRMKACRGWKSGCRGDKAHSRVGLSQLEQLQCLELLMMLSQQMGCLEGAVSFAQAAAEQALELRQSVEGAQRDRLVAREGRIWSSLFTFALDARHFQVGSNAPLLRSNALHTCLFRHPSFSTFLARSHRILSVAQTVVLFQLFMETHRAARFRQCIASKRETFTFEVWSADRKLHLARHVNRFYVAGKVCVILFACFEGSLCWWEGESGRGATGSASMLACPQEAYAAMEANPQTGRRLDDLHSLVSGLCEGRELRVLVSLPFASTASAPRNGRCAAGASLSLGIVDPKTLRAVVVNSLTLKRTGVCRGSV